LNDDFGLYETTVQLLGDVSPPVDFKPTIVQQKVHGRGSHGPDYREQTRSFEILLKSYRARSLHLFPVPDLEGYCEEDMRIGKAMQEIQERNTAPSQSIESLALKY